MCTTEKILRRATKLIPLLKQYSYHERLAISVQGIGGRNWGGGGEGLWPS